MGGAGIHHACACVACVIPLLKTGSDTLGAQAVTAPKLVREKKRIISRSCTPISSTSSSRSHA